MGLSDRERRLLAEMEAALATDDPRLESRLAGATMARPRLALGVALTLLGIAIIFGGLIALRAMKGNILNSRYVEHMQGREITISHPSLRLMQTDGDAHPCDNTIKFRIEPGAQKVIVP